MPQYSPAPAVELIAEQLIPDHHEHLLEFATRIEYVWRDVAAKAKGRLVLGKARKVSGLNAYLGRADRDVVGEDVEDFFVVEIAADVWLILTDEQRVALVDHELSHLGVTVDDDKPDEPPKLHIKGHDCEEFCSVVARHGLWSESVANLYRAAQAKAADGPSLFDSLADADA